VAGPDQIRQAEQDFWDFHQSLKPNCKRDDPRTWDDWLASGTTGIIGTGVFNHSNFVWNARLLPGVRQAFQLIWEATNMIVSYDGGNAFRPWRMDYNWLTRGGWWHVDQNSVRGPHRVGKVCVQGLVTFTDATPETGGLCVIPGSHRFHEEVCKRSPYAATSRDFLMVEMTDPVMQHDGVLVCAKAGIWFCGTAAQSIATRRR